eukprot:TRINITY_DN14810_c0_g1_i1.p1 TRINITY_DN14810_c0_g1~~TRINITY_DN14810_c0_g1_i1.p1  ORF type:complete len:354 (-),score=26.08 TRINITY_DN14810_c0_g1_i1:115-1056(-)
MEDKELILLVMAQRHLCPKSAWSLSKSLHGSCRHRCNVVLSKASWDHFPSIASSKTMACVSLAKNDDLSWLPAMLPVSKFKPRTWELAASLIDIFTVSLRLTIDADCFHTHIPQSFLFPTGLDELELILVGGLADLTATPQALTLVIDCCNGLPRIAPVVERLCLKACRFDQPISVPMDSQLVAVTVTSYRLWPDAHVTHLFTHLPATLRELKVVNDPDLDDPFADEEFGLISISMPLVDALLPVGLRTLTIGLPDFNQPLGPLPHALKVLDLSRSPRFNQALGPCLRPCASCALTLASSKSWVPYLHPCRRS